MDKLKLSDAQKTLLKKMRRGWQLTRNVFDENCMLQSKSKKESKNIRYVTVQKLMNLGFVDFRVFNQEKVYYSLTASGYMNSYKQHLYEKSI